MRVLIVCDGPVPHDYMNYRGDPLARSLGEAGDKVTVVAPLPADGVQQPIEGVEFVHTGQFVATGKTSDLIKRAWSYMQTIRVTRRLLAQGNFDVVRTISTWPTVTALLARKDRAVPIVANVSDFYGDLYSSSHLPFAKLAQKTIMKFEQYVSTADLFIVDTAEQRKRWVSRGVPLEKCVVLPHGLPRSKGGNPGRSDARNSTAPNLRAEFNILPDEKIALYVGDISHMDGVDLLLKATARLAKEMKIHLVIVGSGTSAYLQSLRKVADDLGINDRVHWIKSVPNALLPQLFSQADVCTAPFRLRDTSASAIPNKILEYLTSETNIVCTADTPVEWTVGDAGIFFFPQENVDELTDAMRKSANNPLSQRNYQLARRNEIWNELAWFNILDIERQITSKAFTHKETVDWHTFDFKLSDATRH